MLTYERWLSENADELYDAYVSAREEVKSARQRARQTAKAAVLAGCRELFEEHSVLKSIGWEVDFHDSFDWVIDDDFLEDQEEEKEELHERVWDFLGGFDHLEDEGIIFRDQVAGAGPWDKLYKSYADACRDVERAEELAWEAFLQAFDANCNRMFETNPETTSVSWCLRRLNGCCVDDSPYYDDDILPWFNPLHMDEPLCSFLELWHLEDIIERFGEDVEVTIERTGEPPQLKIHVYRMRTPRR